MHGGETKKKERANSEFENQSGKLSFVRRANYLASLATVLSDVVDIAEGDSDLFRLLLAAVVLIGGAAAAAAFFASFGFVFGGGGGLGGGGLGGGGGGSSSPLIALIIAWTASALCALTLSVRAEEREVCTPQPGTGHAPPGQPWNKRNFNFTPAQ